MMPDRLLIRIATVDAHPIFRAGVRQILGGFPDLVVVGEADGCAGALSLCQQLHPDLLLLDTTLPGGRTLLAQLRERCPATRLVILTAQVDTTLLAQALPLGIAGYLLTSIDAFDFAQALRSAARGFLTLAPEAVAAMRATARPEAEPGDLTEREQAVLALLLQGLTNGAIGAQLHISRSTVKYHLASIYGKFAVRTRAELLAQAYHQRELPTQLLAPEPRALVMAK